MCKHTPKCDICATVSRFRRRGRKIRTTDGSCGIPDGLLLREWQIRMVAAGHSATEIDSGIAEVYGQYRSGGENGGAPESIALVSAPNVEAYTPRMASRTTVLLFAIVVVLSSTRASAHHHIGCAFD